MTDQTAGFAAGTPEHVERELFDCIIIKILRKIIAIFEENGYHSLVGTIGQCSFVWIQDRIGSRKLRSCLFLSYKLRIT